MSELSKLIGKGKKIKLGEVELELKPLTVNSLPLLMQMGTGTPEQQTEAISEIIKITLKEAVQDATDEEINAMSIEYMTPLMDGIMDVNKIEEMSEAKKELLERVRRTKSPGN
jgi:hypothetical protein